MAVHRKNSRFSAAQQRCGGFMACYAAKETSPGLLTAPMFTFLPFKVKPLPVSRAHQQVFRAHQQDFRTVSST